MAHPLVAALVALACCAPVVAPHAADPLPAAVAPTAPASLAAHVAEPPGRVIVRLREGSPLLRMQIQSAARPTARAQALGERLGLPVRSGAALSERSQVLFADGLSAEAFAARLRQMDDVEMAVPDLRRRLHLAPNDPYYFTGPPQTGSSGGPASGQWYLRTPDGTIRSAIGAEGAWQVTTGNPAIVVAVLDTGVRYDHPDLGRVDAGGPLLPGYDMVSDSATANDGDGRDADASDPGDWVTSAENTQAGGAFRNCGVANSSWHGTHMAGLVAARTDNAFGIASIGRQVRVLPVRVLGKCGGFDSDIIAGIRWAAGLDVPGVPANPNPARVINLSLGGPGSCNEGYRNAIAEVNARGTVVVSSAGNSAGHEVSTPANCPGVIAVGGLRHVGTKVGFSDLGPEIALSAPGGNCVDITPGAACQYPIITTTNAGKTTPVAGSAAFTDAYNTSLGTSYAAPLVAGTAALMLSVQPALSAAGVKERLQSSARAFPNSGADNGTDPTPVPQCTAPRTDANGRAVDQFQCYCTTSTCGAGMLDAAEALRMAGAPVVRIAVTPEFPVSGQAIGLDGSASRASSGRSITRTRWSIVNTGGIVTGFASPADAPTTSVLANGTGSFVVALAVTDDRGVTTTIEQRVDVYAAGQTPKSGGGGALGWPWLVALLAAALALRRSPA